jgi:tetratricopeptide (TPR) repeat protein
MHREDPYLLEKEAYSFLSQERFEEAFRLFKRAAEIYRQQKNHKQAAISFASAASCWAKRSGEKTFYNAASSYEAAAREAQREGDLEYASLLYKYAAINYEKEREFINFSDCFYRSKECYRKFLTYRIFSPAKIKSITKTEEHTGLSGFLRHIFLWFISSLSFLIWGYGERPSRAFSAGLIVVLTAAFVYSFGYLAKDADIFRPQFQDAFYFSVVTFTTVGYGDITPVGFMKFVAIVESFCGLFIVPLFVIGLTRKYLRV